MHYKTEKNEEFDTEKTIHYKTAINLYTVSSDKLQKALLLKAIFSTKALVYKSQTSYKSINS